ncbi:transposable element Tcb1 transposase [Trichonephila clavipes]|nr:transposable element Tcb1 transposase [Trichonephila clavipes]
MVWVGISLEYRTNLHIFKRGSVTAVRYRDEALGPILRLYVAAVGPIFVLMDDNARPNKADIVDDYLKSEGIARLAWPEYSPYLNPIENLWDALGRAVSSRFPPPAALIEMETALYKKNVPQSSQTYAQATKSCIKNNSTQTDENITNVKCPPLKLLQQLPSIPKPNISITTPVISTSSSSQAELLSSASSTKATVSEPQPPIPVSSGALSTTNNMFTPIKDSSTMSTSSSNFSIQAPSGSTTTENSKKKEKFGIEKEKKNYLKEY